VAKRKKNARINSGYIRNIIFGAEDALVSTVGFLFGLAVTGQYNSRLLVVAGVVLIAVEALSMGVGSFLSETEVYEMEKSKKHLDSPLADGILMFFAYLGFGMLVLAPYILIPLDEAKYVSVVLTMIMLFLIGYLPTKALKDGIRMFLTAGAAILVGFLVARIV
jgi:VIT1/CCC1 family predicted Fe2+/Mn2+ transporter